MNITKATDPREVKKLFGQLVRAKIIETGDTFRGLFVGFWNPKYSGYNSQTSMPIPQPLYPYNIIREEGVRIAVDSFETLDN